MTKKCVFCGRSHPAVQFSREHVLPAWLSREITLTKHCSYSNQIKGKDLVERNINGQSPFTMTVNKVCRICNNGWMSESLESPVKEILMALIEGRKIALNDEKKQLISLWSIKTALMIGLMDSEGDPAIMSHYEDIYKLKIPMNTFIWLVNTSSGYSLVSTRHMRFTSNESSHGNISQTDCIAYYTSINIGCLSIQILASKSKDLITDFNLELFNLYLSSCSGQLWPIQEKPISWPLRDCIYTDPRVIMDGVIRHNPLLEINNHVGKKK